MRFPRRHRFGAIAICGVAGVCMAFPLGAGADVSSSYAPDPAARNFATGTAGWTSSSSFDGSCIPPLLCPTVTQTFQPVGGADGDGYIQSAFTGVVGSEAVAGTSTGTWESPRFTYAGAAGHAPTSVTFTMNRRANVDQLLAVAGNSATYSVQLIDLNGKPDPTLIGQTTLAGAKSWTAVPAATLKPSQLRIGDNYKIRIVSRYTTGTSAAATGSADYDNVTLRAVLEESAKDGNRAGKLRAKRLLALFRTGMAGTVTLRGTRLLVKVNCPRKVGMTCRITAQGLLKRGKPATRKRTVKVGKGKSRQVVLRVKPKLRAKVAKRKRLLVSEKVRAGKVTATAFKSRKLIRRH